MTMLQEVARKNPAVVVHSAPLETRTLPSADKALIRSASRGQLAAEVTRRWRAGEVERSYQVGRQGDMWVALVALRPPRTWLQRNGLKTALASAGLGLAGWGVLVLMRAALAFLAVALPYFLAIAVLLAVAALAGGGTKITQIVNIKK